MHVFEILRASYSFFPQEKISSTGSCKAIFIVLYADESLPTFFSQICAANFLVFPVRQPHNAYMTATQCVYQVLLQQNSMQYARRSMCGQHRARFRVKETITATQCVYQVSLQQNPVCRTLVGSAGKIAFGSV